MKYPYQSICSKTCVTRTLKKTKKCFEDQLSPNAGQKYCKMLQREHSAIFFTFIKLLVVIKIFVLSIFELFCLFLSGRFTQGLKCFSPPVKLFFTDRSKAALFCGSFLLFMFRVSHAFLSVYCSLVVNCHVRDGLLALLHVFLWFYQFPLWCPGSGLVLDFIDS